VDERVPELLAHIQTIGVVPGAAVRVVRTHEIDETVAL